MIVILEGANGSGKSTLAKNLSETTGAPILRAFKPNDVDFHFTGKTDLERRLKRFNVPYNTYVDDLYVAELLGRLYSRDDNGRIDAILDRSMVSALAHNPALNQDEILSLLELWHGLFGRAVVVYVHMQCEVNVAELRLGERFPGREPYKMLARRFSSLYDFIQFGRKTQIDTTSINWAEGYLQARKFILG